MRRIPDLGDPAVPGSLAMFAREAQDFLQKHTWCKRIIDGQLDCGWDGILAVCRFEIEPAAQHVDRIIWVVTGDLPPAYLCDDNRTGVEALEGYVWEMQRWVDAVTRGDLIDDLIPVNVAPTTKYAQMLQSRLDFIRRELLS